MKSIRTKTFKKRYDALPDSAKNQAITAYRMFVKDPFHPSLQFKQVDPSDTSIYSVRIGRSWRALGKRQNDTIYWFWIGSHEEYNNII